MDSSDEADAFDPAALTDQICLMDRCRHHTNGTREEQWSTVVLHHQNQEPVRILETNLFTNDPTMPKAEASGTRYFTTVPLTKVCHAGPASDPSEDTTIASPT